MFVKYAPRRLPSCTESPPRCRGRCRGRRSPQCSVMPSHFAGLVGQRGERSQVILDEAWLEEQILRWIARNRQLQGNTATCAPAAYALSAACDNARDIARRARQHGYLICARASLNWRTPSCCSAVERLRLVWLVAMGRLPYACGINRARDWCMRDFMRSTNILARESIENRVNRQASRVTCPETPPVRQAQLVWWDTSVVRSSARGRRVRESNGPMARREGSSGSGHNAERQYMLSGRGDYRAPSQAACYIPSSQCSLRRIAPAAHPNLADTTAPTRSPLPLSYLARISYVWYTSGQCVLITTIIKWRAAIPQRAWS